MKRVLSHIENHPDQLLDLRTLSGDANFSTFHFHRLFGLLMGQTVSDYVRQRRLDIAAERLVIRRQLTVMQAASERPGRPFSEIGWMLAHVLSITRKSHQAIARSAILFAIFVYRLPRITTE